MTKIFLIRHAEAEGNVYRRAHGHFDGQITDRGYVQIERLKERFSGEKVDAVYSSDLTRTRVTASSIYEPRNLPLSISDKLREVDMGSWEDTAWGDLEYNDPVMSAHFGRDPALWSVSGSESYENVYTRMTDFIMETARNHDGETIALFSHGFAIRSFFCALMGVESHESHKVPYCDNTAVALMLYDNGELAIEYQSDNSHLRNEDSTFANQNWWRGEKKWLGENMRYMPFDQERDKKLLESLDEDTLARLGASKVYTSFVANEPVGLVGVDLDKDCAESAGWISYIYLDGEFVGKGFGVQLLGQAISEFRRLRREKLRIQVPADSPLQKLCLKYSFVPVGVVGSNKLMEKNIRIW